MDCDNGKPNKHVAVHGLCLPSGTTKLVNMCGGCGGCGSQPIAMGNVRATLHDDSTSAIVPAERGRWVGGAHARRRLGKCRTSERGPSAWEKGCKLMDDPKAN